MLLSQMQAKPTKNCYIRTEMNENSAYLSTKIVHKPYLGELRQISEHPSYQNRSMHYAFNTFYLNQ